MTERRDAGADRALCEAATLLSQARDLLARCNARATAAEAEVERLRKKADQLREALQDMYEFFSGLGIRGPAPQRPWRGRRPP